MVVIYKFIYEILWLKRGSGCGVGEVSMVGMIFLSFGCDGCLVVRVRMLILFLEIICFGL